MSLSKKDRRTVMKVFAVLQIILIFNMIPAILILKTKDDVFSNVEADVLIIDENYISKIDVNSEEYKKGKEKLVKIRKFFIANIVINSIISPFTGWLLYLSFIYFSAPIDDVWLGILILLFRLFVVILALAFVILCLGSLLYSIIGLIKLGHAKQRNDMRPFIVMSFVFGLPIFVAPLLSSTTNSDYYCNIVK